MQSILGVFFLLLGCLHFGMRHREPQTRSLYFGGVGVGRAARTLFAVSELLLGTLLLATA